MKILFIDIPFKSLPFGARQKRSEILLDYCQRENELDLVLFSNTDDFYECEKSCYSNQLSIIKLKNSDYEEKKYSMADGELKKLAELLNQNQYELVFIREINFYPIIDLIDFYLPDAKIIIDQTLVNVISDQSSKSKIFNSSFLLGNHLREVIALKNVFFSFPSAKALKLFDQICNVRGNNVENKLLILENPIGQSYQNKDQYKGPNYFLIYGDYSQNKNVIALENFLKQYYKEIYNNLKKTNSYLYIVGNNASAIWEKTKNKLDLIDRINPIGPVKNIQKYIANCKFTIIPDETQGTNLTRLFETLSQNKLVITEPLYTEICSDLIIKGSKKGELHKVLNDYILNGYGENAQSITAFKTQSFNQFLKSAFFSNKKFVA